MTAAGRSGVGFRPGSESGRAGSVAGRVFRDDYFLIFSETLRAAVVVLPSTSFWTAWALTLTTLFLVSARSRPAA